jgi:hypothetical protein
MTLHDDFTEIVAPWRNQPLTHIKNHAIACKRVFIPYPSNNNLRKYMAAGLFFLWSVITLGEAFGVTELDTISYGVMSAAVYAIIGIQWGFEFDNLPITYTNDDDDDTE